MLAAKYRIPMDKIPQIMRKGKRIHADLMSLVIWKEELPHPLFAIIVSSKVEPSAVGRNRIKRRMRAAIYALLQQGLFANINYIFHVKNNAIKDVDFVQLQEQLNQLITNI